MATRVPGGWTWGEIPEEDLHLFDDAALALFFLRELRPGPIEMEEAPDDVEGAIVLDFLAPGPVAEA